MYYKRNKLDEAMNCYVKAIELKPYEVLYYNNIAAIML